MKKNSRKLLTLTRRSIMNKKDRNMTHKELTIGHKVNITQTKGHRDMEADMEANSINMDTKTHLLALIKTNIIKSSKTSIRVKRVAVRLGSNSACMSSKWIMKNFSERLNRSVKDRNTGRNGFMMTQFSARTMKR